MERKIYLVLTDTGTLFTRLIKLYTKKPYNHASLSFNSRLTDVYSFGRKSVNNPFIGGFVKEDMKTELFKNATCAIYCCTVSDEQYENMIKYIEEIEREKQDYRYNLLGVIGVALNIEVKRERAFFCSQFVASVLREANIHDPNKPLALTTPHDLQKNAQFELIFTGPLKDYYSSSFETPSYERGFFLKRIWGMLSA